MRTSLFLGSEVTSLCSKSHQIDAQDESQAGGAIMCFLDRLADSLSDRMPDKPERHLPFIQKQQVYGRFTLEVRQIYDRQSP